MKSYRTSLTLSRRASPRYPIEQMENWEKMLQCLRVAGYSQARLAMILGVSPTAIHRWENRQQKPSARPLYLLNDLWAAIQAD